MKYVLLVLLVLLVLFVLVVASEPPKVRNARSMRAANSIVAAAKLPCMERAFDLVADEFLPTERLCAPGQTIEIVWEPIPATLHVGEDGDWKGRGVGICRCPETPTPAKETP